MVLPLPIKDDASILTHNVEVPQCITDSSFALNRGRTTHHDSYLLDLKPSGEVGLGGGERERERDGGVGQVGSFIAGALLQLLNYICIIITEIEIFLLLILLIFSTSPREKSVVIGIYQFRSIPLNSAQFRSIPYSPLGP